MINEQCNGCAYNRPVKCAVFTERPKKCWNYTTIAEAEKRVVAIRKYRKKKEGR